MKKTVLLSTVLLMLVITSIAQKKRVDIAAGVDVSKFATSGAGGSKFAYRSGLAGSIAFETNISSVFSIQTGVNYSPQGAGIKNEDGSEAGSYLLKYFTIPLLAKLYGTPRISLVLGPQMGFLTDAKKKLSGEEDEDLSDQFRSIDLYAVFGMEYRFANGVFVNGRYNMSLINAVKDKTTNLEIVNRYFSLRIGYSIPLKD